MVTRSSPPSQHNRFPSIDPAQDKSLVFVGPTTGVYDILLSEIRVRKPVYSIVVDQQAMVSGQEQIVVCRSENRCSCVYIVISPNPLITVPLI
jgi:hypothetical protein